VTEVNLVVKVVDKITAETKKIVGRFRDQMAWAATAAKDFFAKFDGAAFGAVTKGIEKIAKSVEWLGNKLNELAPNAEKFTATFSPSEMMRLEQGAEAFNKLGAAWDKFVGQLLAKGSAVSTFFDELTQRLKQVTTGAQLTEVAAAQLRLAKAEEDLYTFQNKRLTDDQRKSYYYRGIVEGQEKELANARKALELAKERYAVERQRVENFKKEAEERETGALMAPVAGLTPPLQFSADDIRELQRISSEAFQSQLDTDIAAWIDYNSERVEVHADALEGISEEELDFIATMQRIRDEDVQQQIADQEKIAQAARDRLDQSFEEHRRNMEAMAELDRQRIEKAAEEMQKLRDDIDRMSSIITDNFMAAFDSIIQGTESVGRAFTRMIGSILADVGRMMAAEAMKKFISGVLGSLFGGAPSYSTQNGGAFDAFGGEISPLYDTLPGQASGGFVGSRGAFMVGERGPELFVPPSSGNIITAARSGGNSVSGVTINVNGAQDPGRTAREVKAALMSLMSSDPAARQRLRVVASGGGVA